MIQTLTKIVMAVNIAVLLIVGYMMFWPAELSLIYNEPFPVTPEEVKRGETIEFTVDFEKTHHYAVVSHRVIICEDGNLVTLADQSSKTSVPLGHHSATLEIVIPEKVSDGDCFIQLSNTYHINPLRDEHREMRTEDFTIIR